MKKINQLILYITVTLTVALAVNMIVFSGTKLITSGWHHTEVALAADDLIPFIPASIAIYVASFAFWLIYYLIIARGPLEGGEIMLDDGSEYAGKTEDDEKVRPVSDELGGYDRDRFFSAEIMSKLVCLVFFLIMPTAMARPEPGYDTIWDLAVKFVYTIDAPDNLFPSIHCLVSWFCWIGVRNRRDLPAAIRWFAFFFAIMVCISTLTVKQHVMLDVVGGVALAEFCYWLAGKEKIRGLYVRPMKKLIRKLAGNEA